MVENQHSVFFKCLSSSLQIRWLRLKKSRLPGPKHILWKSKECVYRCLPVPWRCNYTEGKSKANASPHSLLSPSIPTTQLPCRHHHSRFASKDIDLWVAGRFLPGDSVECGTARVWVQMSTYKRRQYNESVSQKASHLLETERFRKGFPEERVCALRSEERVKLTPSVGAVWAKRAWLAQAPEKSPESPNTEKKQGVGAAWGDAVGTRHPGRVLWDVTRMPIYTLRGKVNDSNILENVLHGEGWGWEEQLCN